MKKRDLINEVVRRTLSAAKHPGLYLPQGSLMDHEWKRAAAEVAVADLMPRSKPVLEGERDGVTFDPDRDYDRLNAQMKAVWAVVRDGMWHTLSEIAEKTDMPEASVSARLRDLRKERYGRIDVETQHLAKGVWLYRVNR